MTPSWREFVDAATHEVDAAVRYKLQETTLSGDLVAAATIVRRELPAAAWNRLIRDTFTIFRSDVHEDDLAVVRAVWQASSGLVITTNYDDMLLWGTERAPRIFGLDAPVNLSALMTASPSSPVLWHLHGRVARPETVVIAEEGYRSLYTADAKAEERYRAGLMSLSVICATRSLLFVGSSLNDVEIVRVLKEMAETFRETVPEHFLLCHRNELQGIEQRLSEAALDNVTPITFSAFGTDLLRRLLSVAPAPGTQAAGGLRDDAFRLPWARRRCRTITAGSEAFITRVSPLITEQRPARAAEILADLAIDGTTPFERAVASLLRYEFEGRIDKMLEAASTVVEDRAERRNLELFRAIALEKLERTEAAIDSLGAIIDDESVADDLRLCARFNRDVCREKLGQDVSFSDYLAMPNTRTGCGELIWTKAFNMEMVLCGTRSLEFQYGDLLERAVSAEIEDASTGFMKTIVNWSHLTNEPVDSDTLKRIEEQAKLTPLTTRIALLTYLQTTVKDRRLSETIQEILKEQRGNVAVQKLAPVLRLHGRYTLYGEYLMHDNTWGYVTPTRMYLESSATAPGSWVLDTDRVALRLTEMGLHTLGVISGDLPFGRGFATSTVLALLHIGRQLEPEQAEAVTNVLDWMTHGFEPSGVDVKAILAQAPGFFRRHTWRSAPALDLTGVFVTVPKGEPRRLQVIRQLIGRRADQLVVLADRLTDAAEAGQLDDETFCDYCRVLAGLEVYSPRQEQLVRTCLDAGLPAKGIGGLYDKAIMVVGDDARVSELLTTVPDVKVVGRL